MIAPRIARESHRPRRRSQGSGRRHSTSRGWYRPFETEETGHSTIRVFQNTNRAGYHLRSFPSHWAEFWFVKWRYMQLSTSNSTLLHYTQFVPFSGRKSSNWSRGKLEFSRLTNTSCHLTLLLTSQERGRDAKRPCIDCSPTISPTLVEYLEIGPVSTAERLKKITTRHWMASIAYLAWRSWALNRLTTSMTSPNVVKVSREVKRTS